MNHKSGFNTLGRMPEHRKSLIKNMVVALFFHERVITTKTRALAVRKVAEKLVTRAKTDSVHNRRTVGRLVKDEMVLARLFSDIGPRYSERPGGYTRIVKIGRRQGDAAETVVLELVDRDETPRKKTQRPTTKKTDTATK